MNECICNYCVFSEKCTPTEKLFQKNNKEDEECNLFIDINNFCITDWEENGEYFWKEMSWYRFIQRTIE